jgi:hypothetical protein
MQSDNKAHTQITLKRTPEDLVDYISGHMMSCDESLQQNPLLD